jgi:hypothetical protein
VCVCVRAREPKTVTSILSLSLFNVVIKTLSCCVTGGHFVCCCWSILADKTNYAPAASCANVNKILFPFLKILFCWFFYRYVLDATGFSILFRNLFSPFVVVVVFRECYVHMG